MSDYDNPIPISEDVYDAFQNDIYRLPSSLPSNPMPTELISNIPSN